MSTKRGLGRGFASLIPTEVLDEAFDPTADQDGKISDLRHIKLSDITPDPDQPRRQFDDVALDELAASIKQHGVLQPIVVVPSDTGFQIVAGERRYRASHKAGLDKIPAIVRTLSNQHRLEISLIENLQRSDLSPIEMATAYLKLRDQFNLTLDEIGERLGGRSSSTISNTIRLLRLPESVRKALNEGKLREGQVRPLISMPKEVIEKVLPVMIREEWSARKVEQFAVQYKKQSVDGAVQAIGKKNTVSPYPEELARMEKLFAVPVKISTNSRGGGSIVMKFKSPEEFERINRLLAGRE